MGWAGNTSITAQAAASVRGDHGDRARSWRHATDKEFVPSGLGWIFKIFLTPSWKTMWWRRQRQLDPPVTAARAPFIARHLLHPLEQNPRTYCSSAASNRVGSSFQRMAPASCSKSSASSESSSAIPRAFARMNPPPAERQAASHRSISARVHGGGREGAEGDYASPPNEFAQLGFRTSFLRLHCDRLRRRASRASCARRPQNAKRRAGRAARTLRCRCLRSA
jgi:hypothetical protein